MNLASFLPMSVNETTIRRGHRRLSWWKILGVILGGALVLLAAFVCLAPVLAGQWLDRVAREKIREIGHSRFSSTVEVERVRFSLVPPSVTATGILFRHKGRHDVPPLFRIRQMDIRGGLTLLQSNPHASSVRLQGLEIVVPRRRRPREAKPAEPPPKKVEKPAGANFSVSEIVADGTVLQVLSKKPGRDPLRFDLRRLRLHDVSLAGPMRYDSVLTNPKPPGLIQSRGEFGPWNGPEPSLTPLHGQYHFSDADLSVFRGIAGILSSDGKFNGVLEEIEVDGATDVPDFRLDVSENPVHLTTQFHAIVDGTNGDTRLEPVKFQFLASSFVANGAVEGREGQKGKTVRLSVDASPARIEDLLRLAVRGKPLLTGPVRFQTKFELPPGEGTVVDRLRLDGQVNIKDGHFRKNTLQEKIDELSRRGQGEPGNTDVSGVAYEVGALFSMAGGVIQFRKLTFAVPAALVNLDGGYGLRSEELHFQGTLTLDAKVSETTSGVKSLLLRAVDRLLSRDGEGSVVPIKISGTRSKPRFGIDLAKIVRRRE
jgi:hypothetical protein